MGSSRTTGAVAVVAGVPVLALGTVFSLLLLGSSSQAATCNPAPGASSAVTIDPAAVRGAGIAGYDRETVEDKFAGMLRAFRFGAPPHGGIAPGVDRIVMLLADEPNIRETISFPLNGNAQDLMMGAPTELEEARLRELHLSVRKPQPK